MALKSVQFVYPDGSPFALVHEPGSAFALWKAGRWNHSIAGQMYDKGTWQGREAIEKLFDKPYQLS